MDHRFNRVAILGLGLMGASLALALRAAGGARELAGYDVAPGVAEQARTRGLVDRAHASAAEAVAGADLVVLAAPVLAMRDLLAAIAPHLGPATLVTDLGSTKAEVVAWAADRLPAPEHFIGGHPMTGRERSGLAAADATLYDGCVWCLTPSLHTAPDAQARVAALVTALGARPLIVDPAQHDAAVAAISHLPLLAATALMLTATQDPAWELARQLAAGGFRDTTRVASGDPRMARDICLTNTQPLLAVLDAYLARLHTLRDQLAAQDPAIEATFAAAKAARDAWLAQPRQP